jgi:hypothetical protein
VPPYARQIVLTSVVVETFDGVNGPVDVPAGTAVAIRPAEMTNMVANIAMTRATRERLRPNMGLPLVAPVPCRTVTCPSD